MFLTSTLEMIIKDTPSSGFWIFKTNFQKINCYFCYEKQFYLMKNKIYF